MRNLILSGLAVLVCARVEARIFTDTQGRTIDAELIDATLTQAKIRRADGQIFDLKLETLSAADRAYIVAWTRQRAQQSQAAVVLRFGSSQFKQTTKRDQSLSTMSRTENAGYSVTVHNDSSVALENLRIEYRIFMRDDQHGAKKSDMTLKRLEGSERIVALPAKGMTEFKTDTLTLQRSELKADWYYIDGSKKRVADQLAGIWLKAFRADGTQVGEYVSSDSVKKEKW